MLSPRSVAREKRRFARISQERKPIHYVQLAGKAARRILANSSGRRSEPTERSRSCEERICDACRRTSARRSSDGVARESEGETGRRSERVRGWERNEEDNRESTPGEREGDVRRVLESGVAGGCLGGLDGGKKVGVGDGPWWGMERRTNGGERDGYKLQLCAT